MRPEGEHVVVCDAGPIIHLDEMGCLELLADFGRVFVPGQVCGEVERHRPGVLSSFGTLLEQVEVDISNEVAFLTLVRAFALDLGEQAALSLMAGLQDAILLTDDAAARLAGQSLGYRIHGTIGVLVRAIRRGQRSVQEVKNLLDELPQRSSLHIRPALLQQVKGQIDAST